MNNIEERVEKLEDATKALEIKAEVMYSKIEDANIRTTEQLKQVSIDLSILSKKFGDFFSRFYVALFFGAVYIALFTWVANRTIQFNDQLNIEQTQQIDRWHNDTTKEIQLLWQHINLLEGK